MSKTPEQVQRLHELGRIVTDDEEMRQVATQLALAYVNVQDMKARLEEATEQRELGEAGIALAYAYANLEACKGKLDDVIAFQRRQGTTPL
jgi:hypothetical protein